MNATVTEKTEARTVVRIEMLNTAGQAEKYSVIFVKLADGREVEAVNVERTRKNGKNHWALLDRNTHRHQFNRVLQIAKDAAGR